ncbi:MAG TPA: Lrp/AsnC family transcriptional regulator [Burkholderiaceae bacterium]
MEITIDAVDRRLLNALQQDASLSNQALADLTHISAPTCLRRMRRLRDIGLIERQVALLNPQVLAKVQGHGLHAVVEVSLNAQAQELLEAFETRIIQEAAVQQCWRVSPGPDFVLIVYVADMPSYLQLTQRIFSQDANVRNVKAFFNLRCAKFDPRMPVA